MRIVVHVRHILKRYVKSPVLQGLFR